jgi:hypothetical protein
MSESGLTYYRFPALDEWSGKDDVAEQVAVMMDELRYHGLARVIRQESSVVSEAALDAALVEAVDILNNLVQEDKREWRLSTVGKYRLTVADVGRFEGDVYP